MLRKCKSQLQTWWFSRWMCYVSTPFWRCISYVKSCTKCMGNWFTWGDQDDLSLVEGGMARYIFCTFCTLRRADKLVKKSCHDLKKYSETIFIANFYQISSWTLTILIHAEDCVFCCKYLYTYFIVIWWYMRAQPKKPSDNVLVFLCWIYKENNLMLI